MTPEELRTELEKRDLLPAQLAAMMGYNRSLSCRWLKGQRAIPEGEVLEHLAAYDRRRRREASAEAARCLRAARRLMRQAGDAIRTT